MSNIWETYRIDDLVGNSVNGKEKLSRRTSRKPDPLFVSHLFLDLGRSVSLLLISNLPHIFGSVTIIRKEKIYAANPLALINCW